MARKRYNPLCRCKKTGAFTSRGQAETVLTRIQDERANDPVQSIEYMPTRVTKCKSKPGVWHLTSRPGKPWAKGRR